MIEKINIKNMKLFKSFNLDGLKKFNLIVGNNNCGKTSLLECIFLSIAPSYSVLYPRILQFRNYSTYNELFWRNFFHNLDIARNLNIKATYRIDNKIEIRNINVFPRYGPIKDVEKHEDDFKNASALTQSESRLDGLKIDFKIQRGRKIVDRHFVEVFEDKKAKAIKGTLIEDYKEPILGAFHCPLTKYWDIADRLHNLLVEKRTEGLIKVLKNLDNNISSFIVGSDKVVYCDIGLDKMLPLQFIGDGFIQVLSNLLAIRNIKRGVMLIDEIENGLHYSSQQLQWESIIKEAYHHNTQIIATTHSIENVYAFQKAAIKNKKSAGDFRLFRLERDKDKFKSIDFNLNNLTIALEKDWEIR